MSGSPIEMARDPRCSLCIVIVCHQVSMCSFSLLFFGDKAAPCICHLLCWLLLSALAKMANVGAYTKFSRDPLALLVSYAWARSAGWIHQQVLALYSYVGWVLHQWV